MKRRPVLLGVLLGAGLLAASCSGGGSVSAMTESEARVVLADIGRQFEAGLPGPILRSIGEAREVGCESSFMDDPTTTRFLVAEWIVEPTPAVAEIEGMFDELIATMPARGWDVLIDARGVPTPQVSFERRTDGFAAGYTHAADGRLIFGASSPCVDPDPER